MFRRDHPLSQNTCVSTPARRNSWRSISSGTRSLGGKKRWLTALGCELRPLLPRTNGRRVIHKPASSRNSINHARQGAAPSGFIFPSSITSCDNRGDGYLAHARHLPSPTGIRLFKVPNNIRPDTDPVSAKICGPSRMILTPPTSSLKCATNFRERNDH